MYANSSQLKTLMCRSLMLSVLLSLALSVRADAIEKYFFVLPSLANPYWQTVKQGIEDTGKECGVPTKVLSAASDQAKEEFLNLCQAAISQRPAIVVVCTTTDTITLQCLSAAQKAGIKVAVVDQMISDTLARKSGVKLSFSVGTDNVMIGEKAAQFIAGKCKTSSPKILVLEGVVGNTNSAQRVTGFKNELKKVLPKATLVNSVSADWDRLKAMNVTADTLSRSPDLNVIYAANDMMALGAAEATRIAGKANNVIVVGVDGVPDARKAIIMGRLTASVAQLPYLIGKRAVELAKDSVRNKSSAVAEKTPLLVLTKGVLESKTDPLMKYVR